MTEDAFTAEEIKELRSLLEIEKIRKVKNLYSHLMDSRQLEAMMELYTEDAVGEWGPAGTCHGRAEILASLKKSYEGRPPYAGLHITTNMWVELTGPTTAIARTYLHDVITGVHDPRTTPVIWFAIYDEDFKKVGKDWQISRSRIQFLWPSWHAYEDFPRPMTAAA
jgi:hypothetical protein